MTDQLSAHKQKQILTVRPGAPSCPGGPGGPKATGPLGPNATEVPGSPGGPGGPGGPGRPREPWIRNVKAPIKIQPFEFMCKTFNDNQQT